MRDTSPSVAVAATPHSTRAPSRGAGIAAPINKGTAFPHDERRRLGLEGLFPPRVETLDEQAARVLDNIRQMRSPLEQYRFLNAVQAENETLFYRVVLDHLEEIASMTTFKARVRWAWRGSRPPDESPDDGWSTSGFCSSAPAKHAAASERWWPRRCSSRDSRVASQRLASLERPADLISAARHVMYWPAYD